MNACSSTTGLMRFQFLFAAFFFSFLSFQHTAHAAQFIDGRVNAGAETMPLEPRAEPYALKAGSGKVNVRFSVRLTGKGKPSATVYLRRSGSRELIAMNDQGRNGDLVAKDGIYGANVTIDTSRLKPDTCLKYEALVRTGRAESVSSPLRLCVSAFPVRVIASNTEKPALMPDGTKAVADEILIAAKPDFRSDAIHRLATDINAVVVGSIPPLDLYQLKLSAPVGSGRLMELVAQLSTRAEVKSASVNAIGSYAYTPNDPEFINQHGLQLIRANDVWGPAATDPVATGTGVTVTVLDTGLDKSHPDFGTPGNCQLAENDCGAANTDTIGHGTWVTGVVGAKTNNALGVAGVAYGSKIHSIIVAGGTAPTVAQMTQGFTDAAAYGVASVINASFDVLVSTFTNVSSLCGSVNSAVLSGATPIAVVVNAADNFSSNSYYYPARCNVNEPAATPHAGQNEALTRKDLFITVANSTSNNATCGSVDQLYSTSNYGAWVDIAAPGCDIRTTAVGGGYISQTGTSFSAPMVSGAAAILKSCGVALDQIEPTLKTSANVTIPFPGGGSAPRLDVYRALNQVNHAPTGVTFSPVTLYEKTNTAGGYDVGTLATVDPDSCDKHAYSIVGGADAAKFSIGGIASDRLMLTDGVLNFLAKPSYSVIVRVTDFFGATFDQPLTVNVLNVNDAPVGTDKTVTISEGASYAFSVADFGFTDPNDVPPNNLSAVIITTLPAVGQLMLGAVPVTAGQSVAAADIGTLTFIPNLHPYGAPYTSFTFQVVDDGGTANGGVNTDPTPKTLTINATHVNHAPTGLPVIQPPAAIGTRTVGQTLTADTSLIADIDGLGAFSYQWKRDSTNVGTNSSTYTLNVADIGGFMMLCVSYTDGWGTLESLCSAADAIAVGDPHLTTVDGLHYDFQSAGEFVALRGNGGMEIQVRQTPVSTASAITDGYSGLTSGVSINTAVAARVGNHRVTYQPNISGNPASSGLELRVDGSVMALPADGLDLGSGGRVIPSPGGGIQIDFPDQTTLIVTPGWWPANSVWYLNVTVFHTPAYEGIMGARANGSWLPRLSDGTVLGSMPAALHDRYVDLYERFSDSWRVNDKTSLFDYAPETSTRTFTFKEWPKENPPYVIAQGPIAKPVQRVVALRECRDVVGKNEKADCLFDVMVMGNPGIAKTHLLTQKVRAGATSVLVRIKKDTVKPREVVALTATVSRQAVITRQELVRQVAPTGFVQFILSGKLLGKPVKLDSKGQARLKVSRMTVGERKVAARYLPAKGSVFLPSSSLEASRAINADGKLEKK